MSRLGQTLLFVALNAACLLIFHWHVVRVFDLARKDYGEAPILALVERWRCEPISARWWDGPRLTLTCYGPGYYWLVKVISPLTPWDHTLIPGRLLSLLAMLGCAGLVAWMVYRHTRSWEVSHTCGLLYMAAPVVTVWIAFHRVDSLAILFALAAYAMAEGRGANRVISAVLVVAGSLVKQTVVFAAVPVFLYFWLGDRRREAAGYLLGVALLGALAWALLSWLSGGYLLESAIRGNMNPMVWKNAYYEGSAFFTGSLMMAALIVLSVLFVKETRTLQSSLYVIALLSSATIALLLSTKEGSSVNYYLEPTALAAVVVGIYGLGRLWSWHPGRTRVILFVLALVLPLQAADDLRKRRRHPLPSSTCVIWHSRTKRDVLADGVCIDKVIAAGRLPLINDPYLFRLMVDNGSLQSDAVVRALVSGQVGELVLSARVEEYSRQLTIPSRCGLMWSRDVVQAMQKCFVLFEERSGMVVYIHR